MNVLNYCGNILLCFLLMLNFFSFFLLRACISLGSKTRAIGNAAKSQVNGSKSPVLLTDLFAVEPWEENG